MNHAARINKIIPIVYWLFGLLPVIWMIMVLTNYLVTGSDLGHLPKYGIDGGQESYPLPYSGILNMILMVATNFGVAVIPIIVMGHFLIGLWVLQIARP